MSNAKRDILSWPLPEAFELPSDRARRSVIDCVITSNKFSMHFKYRDRGKNLVEPRGKEKAFIDLLYGEP